MHIRVNPEIKAKSLFELSAIQITENDYTTDFEAELLAASNEAHAAVANGTITYKSAAELRAALDAEYKSKLLSQLVASA